MIKLLDILYEAKQVGNIYHFTPLHNITQMLGQGYIRPNEEKQISTTRDAKSDVYIFLGEENNVARLMLDGNKISNNYQIKPFKHFQDTGGKDEYEEQIIINGKNFNFIPYLKRIDLFIINSKDKEISKVIKILQKANIPYKEYLGTPKQNIPYTQSKEGNPEDIKTKFIPKIYTEDELYYPNFNIISKKTIQLYAKNNNNELTAWSRIPVIESTKYPEYYIGVTFNSNKSILENYYTKNQKPLNITFADIPMFSDPNWRKKWEYTPLKKFSEGKIRNLYFFIPKNTISPEDFV